MPPAADAATVCSCAAASRSLLDASFLKYSSRDSFVKNVRIMHMQSLYCTSHMIVPDKWVLLLPSTKLLPAARRKSICLPLGPIDAITISLIEPSARTNPDAMNSSTPAVFTAAFILFALMDICSSVFTTPPIVVAVILNFRTQSFPI